MTYLDSDPDVRRHYREVCEYGRIHTQCRCCYCLKTEGLVVCDNPEHAHETDTATQLAPRKAAT